MYDEHFGLTGRPFQLTPDPAFWYETATHRRAMAYLGYGLAQGEGFIVITGDIGAGKTTLVGHLLDTLDREALNPIKLVSTAIEASDLLRIVATELGANPAGLEKAQLLIAIERGLHAVARTGRRTLLIVDEAQALPIGALEELRMLSNFQAGGHALLQIVLLGQPEFRSALHGSDRLEQLRQRVIAIHHLDPMAPGEVAAYVRHRLDVVGWSGQPGFADSAFAALHRYSEGVPRRLNQIANRVMLHAAVEGVDLVTAATVDMVAADLFADLPTMGAIAGGERHEEPPVEDELPFADPPEVVDPPHADVAPEMVAAAPVDEPAQVVPENSELADQPVEEPQPFAAEPMAIEAEEPALAPLVAAEEEQVRPFRHSWLTPAIEAEPVALAPEPAPAAEPLAPPSVETDIDARFAALEARIEEQDAALRRVLTLMVDWMDTEHSAAPAPQPVAPVAEQAPADALGYVPIRRSAA